MFHLKRTLSVFVIVMSFFVSFAQASEQRLIVDQAISRMDWLLASTADTGENPDYLMAIYCYTGNFVFEEKRGLHQLSDFIKSSLLINLVEQELRALEVSGREFQKASRAQEVCQATQDIRSATIIGVVMAYLNRHGLEPVFDQRDEFHDKLQDFKATLKSLVD